MKDANEDKSIPSEADLASALSDLPGWTREGIFLKKTFVFDNFRQINAFLPHLAAMIVRLNHHPDVDFRPGEKRCRVATSTHSHKAITNADLSLARAIEAWPRP